MTNIYTLKKQKFAKRIIIFSFLLLISLSLSTSQKEYYHPKSRDNSINPPIPHASFQSFNISYQNFIYTEIITSSHTEIHFSFVANDPHVSIMVLLFDETNFNNFKQKKSPCVFSTVLGHENSSYIASGTSSFMPVTQNTTAFLVYLYNSSTYKIPISLTVSTSVKINEETKDYTHQLFKGNQFLLSPAKLYFNDWVINSSTLAKGERLIWNFTVDSKSMLKVFAINESNYKKFLLGENYQSELLMGESEIKSYGNSGYFSPNYNDTWYIIIQNQDIDTQFVEINYSIYKIGTNETQSYLVQWINLSFLLLIISFFFILVVLYKKKLINFTSKRKLLLNIFTNFHRIAKEMEERYDNRPPLVINDEYDVQDLLKALLILHFESIQPEEYGKMFNRTRSRVDFFLRFDNIAIEVKYVRNKNHSKTIHKEIVQDKEYYSNRSDFRHLYFFIYDPNSFLLNRVDFTKDLERNVPQNYSSMKILINPSN